MSKLSFHNSIVLETNMTETQEEIKTICEEVKELLLQKNQKYGNSALQPSRIFSKASAVEQLLVRIDDKLNRIQKGAGLLAEDEDVIMDLIGYLVLLKIGLKQSSQ
jgi:phage shock protein A